MTRINPMIQLNVLLLVVLAFFPTSAWGATINVPADFPTIQGCINAAVSGVDECVVAAGTYNEQIDFIGKAITLRSADGATVTTIDGSASFGSVVQCVSGEGRDTRLDGFTITGGDALFGGGMLNDGGSPTVANCVFEGNLADNGGGMANRNTLPAVGPGVVNCLFINNEADFHGAGMLNDESKTELTNCTFTENEAAGFGGGMANFNCTPVVVNSIMWDDRSISVAAQNEIANVFSANTMVIASCIMDGPYPGLLNIFTDPLFVAAPLPDLNARLTMGSPCIETGVDAAVTEPTDLDGNPRIEQRGSGTARVDMGAYEYPRPEPPLAPAPPHDIAKNRFVSFAPNNSVPVAYRVELLDLACNVTPRRCFFDDDCRTCDSGPSAGLPCTIDADCPGPASCLASGETCDPWAWSTLPPAPIILGWVDDPTAGTFDSEVVATMPALRVWTEPVVHVGDCEIAPRFPYELRATDDGVTFSDPLMLTTIKKPQGKFWGDIVGSFGGVTWSAPNGLVGVDDVSSMIKFLTLKPAPHITRVDLVGETPNMLVGASDLQHVLMAFRGDEYPPISFPTKPACFGGTRNGLWCDRWALDPDCPGGVCEFLENCP